MERAVVTRSFMDDHKPSYDLPPYMNQHVTLLCYS